MLTRAVFPLNVPAEKKGRRMRPLLSEAVSPVRNPQPPAHSSGSSEVSPGPSPVLQLLLLLPRRLLLLPPLDVRTLTDRLTECSADCTNSDAYRSSSATAGVFRTSFKLEACCKFYSWQLIAGKHYISHLTHFNVFI